MTNALGFVASASSIADLSFVPNAAFRLHCRNLRHRVAIATTVQNDRVRRNGAALLPRRSTSHCFAQTGSVGADDAAEPVSPAAPATANDDHATAAAARTSDHDELCLLNHPLGLGTDSSGGVSLTASGTQRQGSSFGTLGRSGGQCHAADCGSTDAKQCGQETATIHSTHGVSPSSIDSSAVRVWHPSGEPSGSAFVRLPYSGTRCD